tara:strand:+ start:37 stop:693 length:657 start_codon:yes stop_codon:yes gene_type:complete
MSNLNYNLIHGDCFVEMKNIHDQTIDVILTSPPYNRKRNDKYNDHNDIKNDYVSFLEKSINECLRVCKGNIFFNIQKNTYNKKDVHKIIGMFSEYITEVIIWKKSNPMPNPHLINAYEYILVLSKNNKSLKANKTYTLNHFTTPVFSSNPYKKTHRAVMHPDACRYILSNFTNEFDTVLDPFMGVCTTGVICKELNRYFIGIEMSLEYYNICKERMSK